MEGCGCVSLEASCVCAIHKKILKAIQFRDNLYKNSKLINPDSQEYLNVKPNLKSYNGILNSLRPSDAYMRQ